MLEPFLQKIGIKEVGTAVVGYSDIDAWAPFEEIGSGWLIILDINVDFPARLSPKNITLVNEK